MTGKWPSTHSPSSEPENRGTNERIQGKSQRGERNERVAERSLVKPRGRRRFLLSQLAEAYLFPFSFEIIPDDKCRGGMAIDAVE
ncbi:Protein of unknown function [Pyronema omphalodes CBS 100304]|uniref:Uncharacterized protein n=1 Tax=Pyronema omphalodes (strain CBS 100304) TaxID=1076935 RepID=U4L7Y0_PYROM|nr:Protein of unknown function [Pyronema omphalodes CBS 100304]